MEDRTGRPVVTAQHTDRFIAENDKMNSFTEAELEMSLESRSFLHRVNIKCERGRTNPQKMRQTFCEMVNVHFCYIASICIHGEELLRQFAFHQKIQQISQ